MARRNSALMAWLVSFAQQNNHIRYRWEVREKSAYQKLLNLSDSFSFLFAAFQFTSTARNGRAWSFFSSHHNGKRMWKTFPWHWSALHRRRCLKLFPQRVQPSPSQEDISVMLRFSSSVYLIMIIWIQFVVRKRRASCCAFSSDMSKLVYKASRLFPSLIHSHSHVVHARLVSKLIKYWTQSVDVLRIDFFFVDKTFFTVNIHDTIIWKTNQRLEIF